LHDAAAAAVVLCGGEVPLADFTPHCGMGVVGKIGETGGPSFIFSDLKVVTDLWESQKICHVKIAKLRRGCLPISSGGGFATAEKVGKTG
jgi:hypothetical protein